MSLIISWFSLKIFVDVILSYLDKNFKSQAIPSSRDLLFQTFYLYQNLILQSMRSQVSAKLTQVLSNVTALRLVLQVLY